MVFKWITQKGILIWYVPHYAPSFPLPSYTSSSSQHASLYEQVRGERGIQKEYNHEGRELTLDSDGGQELLHPWFRGSICKDGS